MGWLGGGKSQDEIMKMQYRYDRSKFQFSWDQIKRNETYAKKAFDAKVYNARQQRDISNQIAKNTWIDKNKLRLFNYRNKSDAYNASVDRRNKQVDYNKIAQNISLAANQNKYNERLTDIGFKQETVLMNHHQLAKRAGYEKEVLDVEDTSIGDTALYQSKKLLSGLEAAKKEAASKGQSLNLEALEKQGKILATGQTGRSSRKNLQTVLAKHGQAQQALTDVLTKAEGDYELDLMKVRDTLNNTRDKIDVQYDVIANKILESKQKTGLAQRQLKESQASAKLAFDTEKQNVNLKKWGADMAADDRVAAKPKLSPALTRPVLQLPGKTVEPQTLSWDKYKKTKPIKGAIAGPSFLQQASAAAGVVSTAITVGKLALASDDRLKYDITRVGTSSNGIPKYTFRYRADGRHGPKYIGTSAQDLLAMGREDAVSQTEKDGFYKVDYSKLDVNMEVVTT